MARSIRKQLANESEEIVTLPVDRERVVSLRVNVCNAASIAERVAEMTTAVIGGYVCFSTVHMVMEAFDNAEYASIVNDADMVIPDGMPLVWMQKLQGRKDAARTRANDMMIRLCELAEEKGWPVGFYGASRKVIDQILARAERDLPSLQIAYAFSPPFRPLASEEERDIIREINKAKPVFLFVGLGCPKQERWMAKNTTNLSAIMFGVGASFDFFAGNVKESPDWLGRLGLEWLFRLWQEPKRLWYRYLVLNPRFMHRAVLQLLHLDRTR